MITLAVKTEKRAIEILQEWIESKGVHSLSTGWTTAQCECGETEAMKAYCYKEDVEIVAYVAICDCCGDDSHMIKDVLHEI